MALKRDFVDADLAAGVHAQHHNDLARLSLQFKGAWSATATYAISEAVTDGYGLYAARADVPSALSAPSLGPGYAVPGGTVGGQNRTVDDYTNAKSIYQAFTVGPTDLSVAQVEVFFALAAAAGTLRVGIATAVGANDSSITWLGATPPTLNNPQAGTVAAPASLVSTLPAAITLLAGATYFLVAQLVSGSGTSGIAENASAPSGSAFGGVASIGTDRYANGGAWTGPLARWYRFNLRSGGTQAPYWTKIADLGLEQPGRTTVTYTTASLAAGGSEQGAVTMAAGYRLLSVQTSAPARVQLYCSTADRTADAPRAAGTDPAANSGVMFDYVTTDATLQRLNPVQGQLAAGSTSVPLTVTATSAGAITVTFVYVRTE